MRIALVTDALFPDRLGGIQKYTSGLLDTWGRMGIQVEVFSQVPYSAAQEFQLKYPCIQFRSVSSDTKNNSRFPGKYLWNLFVFSKKVKSVVIADGEFDVVYCQGFTGLAMPDACGKSRVFHNLHGLEMYQPVRGLKAVIASRYLRIAAGSILKKGLQFISLGAKLNEIIRERNDKAEIFTIPNAVDISWTRLPVVKHDTAKRRFLMVGRYEWRKGFDTLNHSLDMLHASCPGEWEFTIVGDIPGHCRVSLPEVRYTGPVFNESELKAIFTESEVLVCPSYSEGMPTVILEAMAAGLAVIATDAGASGELVNGNNGFLIPPFDATALLEAMRKMCKKNGEELSRFSENSRNRIAEKFLWEKVAEAHLEAFQNRK